MSDRALGRALLQLARSAVEVELGLPAVVSPVHPALQEPGATFVTLKADGTLRGCIGSLEPHAPLAVDVRTNAVGAAFRDPRFAPLRRAELASIEVEVSLLGPSEPVRFVDEHDLYLRLRPGIDGVILRHGCARATFLPQVWAALPSPGEFVAALKRKAGLAAGYWSNEIEIRRYAVTHWAEGEFAAREASR
jgi:AmmeMemoRadiSam system protein A